MLRGIEVGVNKFREQVLLQALQHEETLEHLRTLIFYKSAILDRSNSEELSAFNNLMRKYNEFRLPHLKKERDEAVTKKADALKSLKTMDLSKMKFSKSKVGEKVGDFQKSNKEGVIKII